MKRANSKACRTWPKDRHFREPRKDHGRITEECILWWKNAFYYNHDGWKELNFFANRAFESSCLQTISVNFVKRLLVLFKQTWIPKQISYLCRGLSPPGQLLDGDFSWIRCGNVYAVETTCRLPKNAGLCYKESPTKQTYVLHSRRIF